MGKLRRGRTTGECLQRRKKHGVFGHTSPLPVLMWLINHRQPCGYSLLRYVDLNRHDLLRLPLFISFTNRMNGEIKRGIEYLRGIIESGKALKMAEPKPIGDFRVAYQFAVRAYEK